MLLVNTRSLHVATGPVMETDREPYGLTEGAGQDLMSVMKQVGTCWYFMQLLLPTGIKRASNCFISLCRCDVFHYQEPDIPKIVKALKNYKQ